MVDKRAIRNEYKLKKTPRGIYAIRCKASNEVWVGTSTHLDSHVNSIWFTLRSGTHMDKTMQAAWNTHGEASFSYEILETVDDDVPLLLLKDLLKERRKHWETVCGSPK